MVRKCSQCGVIGHNSRTCTTNKGGNSCGLRLFGVQIFDNVHSSSSSIIPIKKSFSFDCLGSSSSSSSQASSTNSSRINYIGGEITHKTSIGGYLSDSPLGRLQERKKGVPWTEEEHGSFLRGLEKLGKGYWRGISRHFVKTRTPTQVASHAQKFFLRQTSIHCSKRRRSSLFDKTGSKRKANYQTSSVHSEISDKIEKTDHRSSEDLPRKKQWHEDDGKASEKIINFVTSSAAATKTKDINISSNNIGAGVEVGVFGVRAPPPDLELTLSMAAADSNIVLSGSIISVN